MKNISRLCGVTFLVIALFLDGVSSIYDPRVTTTKPPKHRENLPWYEGNWRKLSGSDIEQRGEVDETSLFESGVNQGILGAQDVPFETHDQGDRVSTVVNHGVEGKNNFPPQQSVYNGFKNGPNKPRKEAINILPHVQESTVAKYDRKTGVHCPHPEATGQFVYPPDCKFFVNCWNGRAFVQPCSPGTLFNPKTLECDYPHKVKCYDGEIADFPTSDYPQHSENQESFHRGYAPVVASAQLNNQAINCPYQMTGLLPHPTDCTKFVQCSNGDTLIRDCDAGFVFNPSINICDSPQNVRGCEDVIQEEDKSPLPITPPEHYTSTNPNYNNREGRRIAEQSVRQVIQSTSCPTGFSGLLPHPSDCKKFLQCNHGFAYIMDCGPGTAFNPRISTCDWPYNVPSCETNSKPTYDRYPDPSQKYGKPNSQIIVDDWRDHDGSTQRQDNFQNGRVDGTGKIDVRTDDGYSENQWPTSTPKIPNYEAGNRYGGRQYPHHYPNHGQQNLNVPCEYPECTTDSGSQKNQQEFYPQGSNNENRWSDRDPVVPQNNQNNPGISSTNRRKNYPNHPEHPQYPNREIHGRTSPGFPQPEQAWNRPPGFGNIYVDGNNRQPGQPISQSSTRINWDVQPNPSGWTPNSGPYGNSNQQGNPGRFPPRTWREPGRGLPQHQPPPFPDSQGQGTSFPDDRFYQRPLRPNFLGTGDKREQQDSKMDEWANNSNVDNPGRGHVGGGIKTRPFPRPPPGIYVEMNGTRGHYITKDPEINEGHSNTQNYNDHTHATPRWKPIRNKTNISPPKYPSNSQGQPEYFDQTEQVNFASTTSFPTIIITEKPLMFTTWKKADSNAPTVSIEEEFDSDDQDPSESNINGRVAELDDGKFDIDVLDVGNTWKPRLVFENKTKKTDDNSGTMKINANNLDVDIFNVELAPWQEEEPPFPTYYIPPVHSLGYWEKSILLTPLSGQTIRLRGGTSAKDGYVEVQGEQPGWGVICDSTNGWTIKEAHIVCHQLGYTRGAESAWQGRNKDKSIPSWIAATNVTCQGNETKFQKCKFNHGLECNVQRDAVGVSCLPNRLAYCRKDETPYGGNCYHLADPNSGLNHAEALDYCKSKKSRLVDILTQNENNFLSDWLILDHPKVESIMTSGIGFTMMNTTLWVWEDSNKAMFKFSKWWPDWENNKQLPPRPGSRPVCIIMKKSFPCYNRPDTNCTIDYFFWDHEDCASSMKGHSYICKRPYDEIGCVSGKGEQYVGKANVSASGKSCLSWGDDDVSYPLVVNVVDRDVRQKLKTHNYCRNPNPAKESKPWCFTGAYGEREVCDIPTCRSIGTSRSPAGGQCKKSEFECSPQNCIPMQWVCDGDEDCPNGEDEVACIRHLNDFKRIPGHRLHGYDIEKWINTLPKACALRCKDADFTCRSFSHKAEDNSCLLSGDNLGSTGALMTDIGFDYYEMTSRSMDCEGMFMCDNKKCINQTKVCDGKNDCNDRSDENICTIEELDYEIRLAGSVNDFEGRVEVKVFGNWGQVCDDGFGKIDAEVICKELGFDLGALEVKPAGFFGNFDPPTKFMVDQLQCRGNESSLRECEFDGWGVHNCLPEEAVGIVCKTAVNTCQEGHWKCDNSPLCIAPTFICDEVVDCPDGSDESKIHCEAPFQIRLANGSSPAEGRVEIRHHGVWGTICDDDFSHSVAKVICKSLGYGGTAKAKKDGHFGPGEGPIWLDQVFCHGNETQVYHCEHDNWGHHNCDHAEDVGVVCEEGPINPVEENIIYAEPVININDILPSDCGKRLEDFNSEDDIFAKVVRGSIAPKGSYPWQASIRIRGHSRSSHWCGAVVISPLHVLTAAHCLQGYNKGTYFVRAGDYNTEIDEGTEAEANIEDYYIHKDFRVGTRINNDIALVLLKGRGIPLGQHIMPICLPPENAEYPSGLNCTMSGFGSLETGQSTKSKDLRFGWIPLIDQKICRAEYVYGEKSISDGMVCAGYLEEGPDSCDGDSGGPLACQHNGAFTLYGITSWGHRCGEANKPGVYVRVSHYRDWIDTKIRDSLSGK